MHAKRWTLIALVALFTSLPANASDEADCEEGNCRSWRKVHCVAVTFGLVVAGAVYLTSDPHKSAFDQLMELFQRLDDYFAANNRFPAVLTEIHFAPQDEWGTELQYHPDKDFFGYLVVSAGPDQQFGTADDLKHRRRKGMRNGVPEHTLPQEKAPKKM